MERDLDRVSRLPLRDRLTKDHRYQGELSLLRWFCRGAAFGYFLGLVMGFVVGVAVAQGIPLHSLPFWVGQGNN